MTKRKSKSRQQKTLREYRSLYAKAKKQGLVTDKGDARSYKPTEYSKRRLRELAPYLTEEFGAVKVTPRIARQYKELFDERASRIKVIRNRVVIPKQSHQYVALRKGLPVLVTPLSNGTFEEIILPIRWRTPRELETAIDKHPEWSGILKAGDEESFRFALGEGEPGNMASPSIAGFESLHDLIHDPIDGLMKYESIGNAYAEDEDISGWVKIYRERMDWRFPAYEKEMAKRARQRGYEARKKREERRQERISKLTPEEQAIIREKRNRARRAKPSYQNELLKKRVGNLSDKQIADIREKDRLRKKQQRADRKARRLPREPR